MKMTFFSGVCCLLLGFSLRAAPGGNVIYFETGGTGLQHWNMARLVKAGKDGRIAWDRLPSMALYRADCSDFPAGRTPAHHAMIASGRSLSADDCGRDQDGQPHLSLSGKRLTLMQEAKESGMAVGIVTTDMLVSVRSGGLLMSGLGDASEAEDLPARLIESGVDVIFGGGEEWMLPFGKEGRHGRQGLRKDDRDLIEEARKAGYTVVFTREELDALPPNPGKVFGVFAAKSLYNPLPEDMLAAQNLPTYPPGAPTISELTAVALKILSQRTPFFLAVREGGADAFGAFQNASGVIEAMCRADDALGTALDFTAAHPDTLLLATSENSAGNPDAILLSGDPAEVRMLRDAKDRNGSPVDGLETGEKGEITKPFLSVPDSSGQRHEFVVCWASRMDTLGALVVRAAGNHSERVTGSLTPTDLFPLFHETLFGTPPKRPETAN